MANKHLNASLRLRYATVAQWESSNFILQQGEAAVAISPDTIPTNPPIAVGIKIGDGVHIFNELPWLQAVAQDVPNWAKLSTKPSYYAQEIINLESFIASHVPTNTNGKVYRITYNSELFKYTLQEYNTATETWDNTTSTIDLSSITERLTHLENWAVGSNDYDELGELLYNYSLTQNISNEVNTQFNNVQIIDNIANKKFITGINYTTKKFYVQRGDIVASDIVDGILPVSRGGLGANSFTSGYALIGNGSNAIQTKPILTTIDETDTTSLASAGAIIDYVTDKTAGLTNAMHYIGEATVPIDIEADPPTNPQIANYNFIQARRRGDIILANDTQELIWTGTQWRLLGDEGSYITHGTIINSDIANNANIAQSKINGLAASFALKVDIEDYNSNDRDKLRSLPANAAANVIENIYVNNTLLPVETLDDKPKSVAINFLPYTTQEQTKLAGISAGAEVNNIDYIIINSNSNTKFYPNENKVLNINITQDTLGLNVIEGALYEANNGNSTVNLTNVGKRIKVAKVAATGEIADLIPSTNYVILYCGTSTTVREV